MTDEIKTQRKMAAEGMSDKAFVRFSKFIQSEFGIKMPDAKKVMLQARLQKRLWKLGFDSFDDYCDYVFSSEGLQNEVIHMIDVVTTNKTDFFREPKHFEYLVQSALPELINRNGVRKQLTVWCAGCSTGEEPYSLAMILNEYVEQHHGFDFFILATDISTKVLQQATLGIYDTDRIEPVPADLRRKYLLKSKEKGKSLVRVAPELRSHIRFRRVNIVEKDFGFREQMDIIFCRNVIIYFDRSTQEGVLERICQHLSPGGYLFTGHSETLNGMHLPLIPAAHTVYQKDRPTSAETELPVVYLKPAEMLVREKPGIIRTILGSCIAVTMFNRRLGITAICHALLPKCPSPAEAQEHLSKLKYVDTVIPEMIRRIRNFGVEPDEIEVKLFGGSDMLGATQVEAGRDQPVGRLNIETAKQVLHAEHLVVSVTDVGGKFGRKIFFYTHTGEVLLKRLKADDVIL